MNQSKSVSRLNAPGIKSYKSRKKISVLTAYDYCFAHLLDEAGIDVILVGDSLGMVMQGHDSTLPVTLEEMIYHSRCVARAVKRALVVGDLPFGSYQVSTEEALAASLRLVKEGAVAAVKLEGGKRVREAIKAITAAGIPVMGHIGMTPQSVHQFGGFKVQGRGADGAIQAVIDDALAVESAGAFSVVLECVPMELAAEITERLSIPTIGIGAGPHCDGQVLVMHDLLGLNPGSKYKFVRRYAELGLATLETARHYVEDVVGGKFPLESESFHAISDAERISRYDTIHDSISRAS